MSPYIIIGLFAGVPLLLAIILRVHTSALFLSIAAGYLLAVFSGETAGLISTSIVKDGNAAMVTKLIFFYSPIVITLWLMRKSLAVPQVLVHFIPMVGCAALILVLGVPLLSQSTQDIFYSSSAGNTIRRTSDGIVSIAVASQLLLMWITARPRHNQAAGHHGRHKR